MIAGAMLLLCVFLFTASSPHVMNGDQVFKGSVTVTGDLAVSGNGSFGRSLSSDTLIAVTRLLALQCIVSNHNALTKDSLSTRGPILAGNFAYSGLPASAPNGTILYCRDCTSASDTTVGGGNGALTFRQNGKWKSL
jgi:hypothetical protein